MLQLGDMMTADPERMEAEGEDERLGRLLQMSDALHAMLLEVRAEISRLASGRSDEAANGEPIEAARMVRRLRARMRRIVGARVIHDPGFDVLLDMVISRSDHQRVSVSAAAFGNGVAATTSLRWINRLCDYGIVERIDDPSDNRRSWVQLKDQVYQDLCTVLAQK